MADKRISQLVERTDIANNDVVPIVASGATTTNKATISSIQEFMQENLDLGVTSVGVTISQTDGQPISVTGSPITTSGNITINLPRATDSIRGLLDSEDFINFSNKQPAGNYVTLDTAQTITAQKVFTTSGSSDSVIITHGSGSGFALDVIKAGNGEVVRVNKTSGSGNAMSIIGGNFGAEDATFSKDVVINGVNVGRGGGNATENTRLGNSALGVNTTGTGNTAAGSSALSKNTTGGGNTAVGTQTLQENTTGSGNTALGWFSLHYNTGGSNNSALGYLSLYENTTGQTNVGIGFYSLFKNTTGSDNTALGYNSGAYIANGITENSITNGSVFIGTNTRALANNQTNQIVIGHNAIGNGSNTVTIGNSSITDNYFTGNIRGGAFIRTGGTSSQFLKADGSVDSSTYLTTGSAASTYLPLTGGILTGNLTLTASPLSIGAGNGLLLNNPANTQYFQLYTNASNELNFGYGGTSPVVAKIASTGAVTLTGALNGTSAIFTGSITSYDTLVSRTLTNTTPTLLLSRNNADNGFGVMRILDGGTISFENGPTGATQTSRLSLDGTTGAATFSSSVGIGGVVATDYGAFRQLAVFGGSTGGGITIASTGTATGVLTFANGTSGTNQFKGIIEYQHATDTMVFGTNAAERMRITSGFSVSVPNATFTTLFDIASVLTVGSTGIVNVYASSGSGLGVATLVIMRDGIGGVSQAQIGTQPTAAYLSFQISGTNLQVFAAIGAGTHTVQGTVIRISS